MKTFDELLSSSVEAHGHLCPGQIIGVRMAILGCRLLGFDVPCDHAQLKKLIVFVEMDRCAADAISHTAGVRLGRRSLKFVDYGIMAATFVNPITNESYRVLSTEEARGLAHLYAPYIRDKYDQQTHAYLSMPDDILFKVQKVQVNLSEYDLPGPTRRKITCAICGQVVRDNKQLVKNGKPICHPCSGAAYFKNATELNWTDMRWTADLSESPRIENVKIANKALSLN